MCYYLNNFHFIYLFEIATVFVFVIPPLLVTTMYKPVGSMRPSPSMPFQITDCLPALKGWLSHNRLTSLPDVLNINIVTFISLPSTKLMLVSLGRTPEPRGANTRGVKEISEILSSPAAPVKSSNSANVPRTVTDAMIVLVPVFTVPPILVHTNGLLLD